MSMDYSTGWCTKCNQQRKMERRGINHIFHLLMTIITFGIWSIVWLGVAIRFGGWSCSECGSKDVKNVEWPLKDKISIAILILLAFIIAKHFLNTDNFRLKTPEQSTTLTTTSAPSQTQSPPASNVTEETPTAQNTPAQPSSTWRYSSDEDTMRHATTYYAYNTSENIEEFPFPYHGGSHLVINLRKSPKFGKNAYITISKGQFLCAFSGCEINVKFDENPIEKFRMLPAEGTTDTLFFKNYNQFINGLKKSKTIIIEANFYDTGYHQFQFNVAGLNWDSDTKKSEKETPKQNQKELKNEPLPISAD